ncbi:MAG: long-chain fatty-acid-CoA ligase [Frankiales bacterium]|nr:long-chain fatty-acid-CoA ligase [Frankiales bacterium]
MSVFDGPPNSLTLPDLVRRAADARPAATALVDGPIRWSWSDLRGVVSAVATGLIAGGADRGDRIVVQAGTSADFVAVYLAAWQAGLIVVPANPAYTVDELEHILADSGARILVTGSVVAVAAADRLIADHPALERVIVAARSGTDELPTVSQLTASGGSGEPQPARDRCDDEVAVILYTSGTSGRPKGAMLSSRALVANLAQLAALQPGLISASDTILVPLPLFHVFGLNAALGLGLYFGCTVVLSPGSDATSTLATMAAERVSVVVGAPLGFAHWATSSGSAFRAGFSGVRFALSGSAPLPAELVSSYAGIGVALFEGYGLTEAAPVVTINLVPEPTRHGWADPKPGSIGRPLPGVEVKLLDADGDVAEPGDLGIIAVRGANLFRGYWPDATDGPDADGWFSTGDLAVADDDGDLYLVGRRADLIIVNGFNVYPAEVEAVFGRLPGVSEVAVVGVDDEEHNQLVLAYVVPSAGAKLDPADLLERAGRSLARFKLPSRVIEVARLPHTATGKVQKWRLAPRSVG